MKNHRGFITVVIMIVMALSLIMLTYIMDINVLQSLILSYSKNHIQSFYSGESKVLLCLNDEDYIRDKLNPILDNAFRTMNFASTRNIEINPSDLEDDDMENKMYLNFLDIDNIKHMNIKVKSNASGNISNVLANVSLVNELYERGSSIVDSKTLKNNTDCESLINQIQSDIDIGSIGQYKNIYGFQTGAYQEIHLASNNFISSRESMVNPYIEFLNKTEIFVVCKKYQDAYINFYIDEGNNNNLLSGIIYVEGNLNITTNFKFNGIMIISGGKLIIEADKKLDVDGMVIYINNEEESASLENLNVVYKRNSIYKYGSYLPGFFDIKLKFIKSV